MVKILLIIPYQGVKERFERLVAAVEEKDIAIETTHIYGTGDELVQDCDADIIIARGMTAEAIHRSLPDKQMVEITMTSFDIMEAIVRSKEQYSPGKLALCLHNASTVDTASLEALSGLRIFTYNTSNEEEVGQAIESALAQGAEVFVGGLTICQRCDALGLPRIHIKTSQASIERAIVEAVNAAKSLNLERAKTNMIQVLLNNASEAILSVNRQGLVQAANNQAHLLYGIPAGGEVVGRAVEELFPGTGWAEALATGNALEKLQQMGDKLFFVRCKPILVDSQGAGVLVAAQSTAAISETESKIRKTLSEKGLVAKYTFANIIGKSDAMQHNISMAKKYAEVDANVLISGETGTGKELFAHSIHSASRRRDQPFVAVNCAALPENLLESELFGYVEGAFSGAMKGGRLGLFELAHGGTIFLDEIGEIPIALQAKLLRVLQEKEIRRVGDNKVRPVDVRVISATNQSLIQQVAGDGFRADLYYRLNLLSIQIPPLRERREDIPPLAEFFLKRYAAECKRTPPRLSPDALALLCGYALPGNARELRNICERFVVLSEGEIIRGEDMQRLALPEVAVPPLLDGAAAPPPRRRLTREEQARSLGVSRTTLWRRMKQQNETN